MRLLMKLFAALAAFVAVPASAADWYLAETDHFKIYSEDKKEDIEEFARELERLDEVLRIISGIGPDDGSLPPSSKVVVFRFGETRDMARLAGAPRSGIGGFFIPRASGSYAFVPVQKNKRYARSQRNRTRGIELEPRAILFHEYVHYFMFQHRNAPYPAWYREGFAEILSTLRLEEDSFAIGDAPTWRSIGIMSLDVDVEAMMAPTRENGGFFTPRIYGHGWLLSSLLNFTPERRPQITDYVTRLARGEDRIEAAEAAFGDLDVLQKELEDYRRGAAIVMRGKYMYAEEPKVSIRKLSEAEEARIDMMMRSKVGVDKEAAAKQLPEARELVQRYPDSAPVLLAAAEVEFDNRNFAEAETLVEKVLEQDPQSTEAAIYYANTALMRSLDDPSMLQEARTRFAAANNMENDHPVPLYGYYLTYLFADEEVPQFAKDALESAYQYAPFDGSIRQALAHMFFVDGEIGIGKALLNPLIQTGHGSRIARCLSHELDLFEQGDTERLLKRLKPEHPGTPPEEEDEEGEDSEEEEEEDCGEDPEEEED